MKKTNYTYSLATIYQFEYAIYMLLSGYFKSVSCDSNALETLRLYYTDLVKTSRNGNCSYERQYEVEDECKILIKNALKGKIHMPPLHTRNAKVTISKNSDGTHSFTFRSGVYYFTYRLVLEEEEQEKTPKKNRRNQTQVITRIMHMELTDTWDRHDITLKALPKKESPESAGGALPA